MRGCEAWCRSHARAAAAAAAARAPQMRAAQRCAGSRRGWCACKRRRARRAHWPDRSMQCGRERRDVSPPPLRSARRARGCVWRLGTRACGGGRATAARPAAAATAAAPRAMRKQAGGRELGQAAARAPEKCSGLARAAPSLALDSGSRLRSTRAHCERGLEGESPGGSVARVRVRARVCASTETIAARACGTGDLGGFFWHQGELEVPRTDRPRRFSLQENLDGHSRQVSPRSLRRAH